MEKNLGIYIHIPFCASKCAYCDFYSLAGHDKLIAQYQTALLRHIREYAPQLDGYLIDTVYFGGGTPSYYGSENLINLFNALKKYGHVLVDSEVTVEVNPDSISSADLVKLRRNGFNRLSVGVQSANDTILKNMGRRHDFAKAEEAIQNGREAGFDNISIDLIYGLPSQSKDDWAETLGKATALKPDHISCYGLKIEEGTPLYIFRNSPFLPDDDTQADMYLYAVEMLSRFGYKQYEISNFARRGFESRHNMKYWCGDEYLGFGAAAHSYIGERRYSYISDVEKYSENVMSDRSVVDQSEEISDFEKASEYLILRLRTVNGISDEEYRKIYPCRFDNIEKKLKTYETNGWASFSNGRWSFTPQGFLLSNTLICEILDAQTEQRAASSRKWLQTEENEDIQLTFFESKAEEVQMFRGI